MKRKEKICLWVIAALLLMVWAIQLIPSWGECYARCLYPIISYPLRLFSNFFPFSIGDLFIAGCILWFIIYPIYAIKKHLGWKRIVLNITKFLACIYIWFYLAWGLNYSQYSFYIRTQTPYTPYSAENFKAFLNDYIPRLNQSFVHIDTLNANLLRNEIVKGYFSISDSMGINAPKGPIPKAKEMVFSKLASMVGVSGSMAPFFCEFTINSDVLPLQYPSTYAHELSHLLGITNEAEASFYAYQVCTLSDIPEIRFSGYFSILRHVLNNVYQLMTKEEFEQILNSIRPEIIKLSNENQKYWTDKYQPIVGKTQAWIYDIYLKGNKIDSGRKNYSEVIGLLISYQNK